MTKFQPSGAYRRGAYKKKSVIHFLSGIMFLNYRLKRVLTRPKMCNCFRPIISHKGDGVRIFKISGFSCIESRAAYRRPAPIFIC